MHIFIYGPPGAGKTTLGRALAERLDLPFCDLDSDIERQSGRSIPQIFEAEGEAGFRRRELEMLRQAAGRPASVIALGGGALLDPQARALTESSGPVICLRASLETLLARLDNGRAERPLLAGSLRQRLERLLLERAGHYASFPQQLDTDSHPLDALAWEGQALAGAFRVRGMGRPYAVRIDAGGLERAGATLREHELEGPVALVTDRTVGAIYQERVLAALAGAGYQASVMCIEPGEAYKTMNTVLEVWDFLIRSGIERGSTIVALGGGVVGDLTGFAASAFLRGVRWVNLPTSLLAMVDASLGGKTGVDLPQAKNLVGAFYPPALVLADPRALATLPEREIRGGLAEVVKHGAIGDPALFEQCERGWQVVLPALEQVARQAMVVKLKVIEADPFEKGERQALNLGHTIGHGVEQASGYRLSHGEAVSIGMVAEARLAERIGLAEKGLAARFAAALAGLGLPVRVPAGVSTQRVLSAMQLDKKRAARKVRFALPARVGCVKTGVVVDGWEQLILEEISTEGGTS